MSIGLLKKFRIKIPKESYPNTFFIHFFYKNLDKKQSSKAFKIKANPYLNRIDILLSDTQLNNNILNFISKYNIDPSVDSFISIRLGKLGKPVVFEWENSKIKIDG